jgi:hypothetical protein
MTMPRQARLDEPGTLHHVMIRGIERKTIFRDDEDRKDFVVRLGNLTQRTGTRLLAWSLLPNHVFPRGNQVVFLHEGNVPGDIRLLPVYGRNDFADAFFPVSKKFENPQAGWLGHGL